MTWITTYTGRTIDFLNPSADEVHILDIAKGLASQVRFNGQIDGHYSVAEHSVWVSRLVPGPLAFYGLLHDASESYMSDVVKPLKDLLPAFEQIESLIMMVIWSAMGVEAPSLSALREIKDVDMRMLATEKEQLIRHSNQDWPRLEPFSPYDIRIESLEREAAFQLFLRRYNELHTQAKVA